MTDRYPPEILNDDDENYDRKHDNGTMPDNVEELRQAVVGHRIVKAERRPTRNEWSEKTEDFYITLDNGHEVRLLNTDDCCAHTTLEEFLLHPEMVDHVILGVGTTDEYDTWHIFADMGDVLKLTVGWSAGNPFYYGYGFHITVAPVGEEASDMWVPPAWRAD